MKFFPDFLVHYHEMEGAWCQLGVVKKKGMIKQGCLIGCTIHDDTDKTNELTNQGSKKGETQCSGTSEDINSDKGWLSLMKMARFQQEQNVTILENGNRKRYVATKDLKEGDELIGWFDDSMKFFECFDKDYVMQNDTNNEKQKDPSVKKKELIYKIEKRINALEEVKYKICEDDHDNDGSFDDDIFYEKYSQKLLNSLKKAAIEFSNQNIRNVVTTNENNNTKDTTFNNIVINNNNNYNINGKKNSFYNDNNNFSVLKKIYNQNKSNNINNNNNNEINTNTTTSFIDITEDDDNSYKIKKINKDNNNQNNKNNNFLLRNVKSLAYYNNFLNIKNNNKNNIDNINSNNDFNNNNNNNKNNHIINNNSNMNINSINDNIITSGSASQHHKGSSNLFSDSNIFIYKNNNKNNNNNNNSNNHKNKYNGDYKNFNTYKTGNVLGVLSNFESQYMSLYHKKNSFSTPGGQHCELLSYNYGRNNNKNNNNNNNNNFNNNNNNNNFNNNNNNNYINHFGSNNQNNNLKKINNDKNFDDNNNNIKNNNNIGKTSNRLKNESMPLNLDNNSNNLINNGKNRNNDIDNTDVDNNNNIIILTNTSKQKPKIKNKEELDDDGCLHLYLKAFHLITFLLINFPSNSILLYFILKLYRLFLLILFFFHYNK